MTKADIEWKNRVLCSDGSCIGVIGPDGRCKECGLPFEGELPFERELPTPETAPDDNTQTTGPTPEQSNDGDPDISTAPEQPETTSDDEWPTAGCAGMGIVSGSSARTEPVKSADCPLTVEQIRR